MLFCCQGKAACTRPARRCDLVTRFIPTTQKPKCDSHDPHAVWPLKPQPNLQRPVLCSWLLCSWLRPVVNPPRNIPSFYLLAANFRLRSCRKRKTGSAPIRLTYSPPRKRRETFRSEPLKYIHGAPSKSYKICHWLKPVRSYLERVRPVSF